MHTMDLIPMNTCASLLQCSMSADRIKSCRLFDTAVQEGLARNAHVVLVFGSLNGSPLVIQLRACLGLKVKANTCPLTLSLCNCLHANLCQRHA